MASSFGGEVYNYSTEPDDALKCLICMEVAERPLQHSRCGKLFCRDCLEQYGVWQPCPNCRMEQPQYFNDSKSEREIQSLLVRCRCQKLVERRHYDRHLERECDYEPATCKYKILGCNAELSRKDMCSHEQDDKLHLRLALDTIATMKKKFQESNIPSIKNGESLTFQVRPDNRGCWKSFYTHPLGYHMGLLVDSIDARERGLGIEIVMLKGLYDTRLKWPFQGTVTVSLLNQVENRNHFSKNLLCNDMLVDEDSEGCFDFITQIELEHYNRHPRISFVQDDTMYFKVSVKVSDSKPWLECTDSRPH